MTNKEALIAVIRLSDLPDNVINKSLLDQELIGTEDYSADNMASIDLAALAILKAILHAPDVTEGGYSIKYDRSAIAKRIASLETENGLIPAGDNVKSRSYW